MPLHGYQARGLPHSRCQALRRRHAGTPMRLAIARVTELGAETDTLSRPGPKPLLPCSGLRTLVQGHCNTCYHTPVNRDKRTASEQQASSKRTMVWSGLTSTRLRMALRSSRDAAVSTYCETMSRVVTEGSRCFGRPYRVLAACISRP